MKNEPVAVLALIRVAVVLAGYFGFVVGEADMQTVMTAAVAVYAAIEVVTTALARARVTPVTKAKEAVDSTPLSPDTKADLKQKLGTGQVNARLKPPAGLP